MSAADSIDEKPNIWVVKDFSELFADYAKTPFSKHKKVNPDKCVKCLDVDVSIHRSFDAAIDIIIDKYEYTLKTYFMDILNWSDSDYRDEIDDYGYEYEDPGSPRFKKIMADIKTLILEKHELKVDKKILVYFEEISVEDPALAQALSNIKLTKSANKL